MNQMKVLHILSSIGMIILVFTLPSCAMLGLSTARQVEKLFLEAQALEDLMAYNAAIEKYQIALKEFRKPGVTLGIRPHVNENFPVLLNRSITRCRSKLIEHRFLEAEESYHQKYYGISIEKYELALKEPEKHGLTFDSTRLILINYRIASCYLKLAEQSENPKILYSKAIVYAEKGINHLIGSEGETYQLRKRDSLYRAINHLKSETQSFIATVHFGIGKIFFEKKDYKKALSNYQLALQSNGKKAFKIKIQLAMTFAYLNQGDVKNAIVTCKGIRTTTENSLKSMLTVDPTIGERLTIAKGVQLYLEAENTISPVDYKEATVKYHAALTEILGGISTAIGAEYQKELNYILGSLFYKTGRFESAEKQLTKAIEKFPDSNFVNDAWYAIGDMNYKLQSYMECRDAFRAVLDGFPNSDLRDDAQYFIAKSLLEELEYEKAYLAFNELSTEDFQKYSDLQDDARYHSAYCLNLLNRDDVAINEYESFLFDFPKSPYRVDACFDLGVIYARQQDYAKARGNYALAMQQTDDQALLSEIQMVIGLTYYNQGDYKNAIITHTALLEKYPESDFIIEAKLGIANSYYRMGEWREAADAYERVINEHPEAINYIPYCAYQIGESHYELATNHSKQGKTELAVANFHKALEWYQNIIDDLSTETSDNLDEIAELLITSLTRMCNDLSIPQELQSLAQLKKGDSYLATKQYGRALAEYNTLVQAFPNSTKDSSIQEQIEQVQELIISKNLQPKKVRTTIEIPIAQQIAQKALASTVLIRIKDAIGDPLAIGSGFFISKDQIVSNWHVVEGAMTAYALSVDEKKRYDIEGIIAMNPKQDLVILKVSEESSPLPLGDSHIVQIGESIYVTGNPKGWTGTFSTGVVSGFQMRYQGKRIQIAAPVSPGSSGGPVLNDKGEVIGIVYAGHGGPDAQNLNLAIPVNYLKALLNRVGPPIPLSAR